MEVWIALLIGFMFGVMVVGILDEIKTAHGTLRIDHSNPEKDVYRFDVTCHLSTLKDKTRITFKIDNNADLSQK